MVLAFLNLLAWEFGPVGVSVMAITLCVRAITALWVANVTEDGNVWHFFPILFLSDLFNAILFVTSFCGNRISWRGTEFTLLRGGKLEAVVPEIPVSERM